MGPQFKEALLESENATSQTAKQKEGVKSNVTDMGILIKTNKSEDILVILEDGIR